MEAKGKINVYHCETCGGDTVTVNLDAGVTPMFLKCRAGGFFRPCGGTATSRGYQVPQDLVPDYAWYAPTPEQRKKMDPAMRDHCERGGLNIRKLDSLERLTFGAPSPRSDGS